MGISKIPNDLQVVESGNNLVTGGFGWRWKKYSDGTAEAWGYFKYDITTKTQWNGNIYYSNVLGQNAYPTGLFTSEPFVFICPTAGNADGWISNPKVSSTPKVTMPKFYFVDFSSTTGKTLAVSVYAYGYWK